jgi:hypothetical protein
MYHRRRDNVRIVSAFAAFSGLNLLETAPAGYEGTLAIMTGFTLIGSGRLSSAARAPSPAWGRRSVDGSNEPLGGGAGPGRARRSASRIARLHGERLAELAVSVLLVALLGGCGGSKKGADDASGYEPKSETPWKAKTREQRMDWMGSAVFPKMRQLFLEQDSEKYEDFACQTCHGTDMELVDFKMPNELFALSPSDPIGQAKEYDEKTADFMLGAVVPGMAKLLDEEAFTLEHQTGFGCTGCHPTSR